MSSENISSENRIQALCSQEKYATAIYYATKQGESQDYLLSIILNNIRDSKSYRSLAGQRSFFETIMDNATTTLRKVYYKIKIILKPKIQQ